MSTESRLHDRAVDWAELIARHDRRVLVALLGQGVPIERAKEICQETWAKLIEKHDQGGLAELKLPGLAITQALFLAKDAARQDLRRPQAPLSETPEREDRAEGTAEAQLLTKEQARAALYVLQRLPLNARRAFELAYDDPGMSHKDIAARLQLSEQRVRQILCEVRQALRGALEVQS